MPIHSGKEAKKTGQRFYETWFEEVFEDADFMFDVQNYKFKMADST